LIDRAWDKTTKKACRLILKGATLFSREKGRSVRRPLTAIFRSENPYAVSPTVRGVEKPCRRRLFRLFPYIRDIGKKIWRAASASRTSLSHSTKRFGTHIFVHIFPKCPIGVFYDAANDAFIVPNTGELKN
jgi:hypothetical protein